MLTNFRAENCEEYDWIVSAEERGARVAIAKYLDERTARLLASAEKMRDALKAAALPLIEAKLHAVDLMWHCPNCSCFFDKDGIIPSPKFPDGERTCSSTAEQAPYKRETPGSTPGTSTIATEPAQDDLVVFLRGCNTWLQDEGVLQGNQTQPEFNTAADAIERLQREKVAVIGNVDLAKDLIAKQRTEIERKDKLIAELEEALQEADGCFEAALFEGWIDTLENGDLERIRDLWQRRISMARVPIIAALAKAEEGK